MIHVVEVRFAGENFRTLLLRVRGWLNTENAWPSTFCYWFSGPDARLQVKFESEDHARALADEFGGSVLIAEPQSRPSSRGSAVALPRSRQESSFHGDR
jgi:hypothetical protein